MSIFTRIRDGLKKTRDAIFGKIDMMLKSFTKIGKQQRKTLSVCRQIFEEIQGLEDLKKASDYHYKVTERQ